MSDCELDNSAIASAHYKPCYTGAPGSSNSGDSDDERFQDINVGNLFGANITMHDGKRKTAEDTDDSDDSDEGLPETQGSSSTSTRRKYSMAHDDIVNERFLFLHVDLETGGEDVGVIQISCVCHDYAKNEVTSTFNSYIQPPNHVKASSWNEHATRITGLHHHSPEIANADQIDIVWPKFKDFCEKNIGEVYVGCLVAWNGKGSDCKWLWKITKEMYKGRFSMPEGCIYFMDPMGVIKHYKGCKLNVKNSGVIGMGLANIYCYVSDKIRLEGEHNALNDVIAQSVIVKDERFRKYVDKPQSIQLLDSIWADKRKKREARQEELTRPVPIGWSETIPEDAVFLDSNRYNKSHSGWYPVVGTGWLIRMCTLGITKFHHSQFRQQYGKIRCWLVCSITLRFQIENPKCLGTHLQRKQRRKLAVLK